jgi:predicted AlkP superfamily pyrophosphatase or phosphodiesterase
MDTPRLLMVSLDAVGDQDVDILMTLPNFSSLCSRGTLVRNVSSIFISNTYPTHTTIQTGVHPCRHGVFDNDFQSPCIKIEKWRFHVDNIRVKTLPEQATLAGKTVCSILFPVTGGAKIKYNFPEIPGHVPFWHRLWHTFRVGSAGFVASSMLRKGFLLRLLKTSHVDDFASSLAGSVIRRKKPDLVMVHLLDADVAKHHYGPHSPESRESLVRLDRRLGRMIASIEKAGLYDSMSVLVFSDHNCCDVHTSLRPNRVRRKHGISDQDAWFHCSQGCCFLRITNQEKKEEIAAFVQKFLALPAVERLLTEEEMHLSGADQEYAYGFAAAAGFCFGRKQLGQHGYTLDREQYHTFYVAAGRNIPQNRVQNSGRLLDICPLAVDLLGLETWDMEGVNAIFKT